MSFLRDLGLALPPALTAARGATARGGRRRLVSGAFNLPAAVIVLLVTALLVIGIRQSADTNTVLVVLKVVRADCSSSALGAAYVRRENLVPVHSAQHRRVRRTSAGAACCAGAAVMFFAYVGFDAVSTAAQEAREPAARHADRDPRVAR